MSEPSGSARPPIRPRFPLWLEAAEAVITGAVVVSALAIVVMAALGIYLLVRSASDGWQWWTSPAAFAGSASAAVVCRALWRGLQKTERAGEAYETSSAWDEYRRRVRCFLGVLIGGLLSMIAVVGVPPAAFALVIVLPIWVLAFCGAGLRLKLFECPRCHRPFFQTWDIRNQFANYCLHCSLPKWDEPDQPGEGASEPNENGD